MRNQAHADACRRIQMHASRSLDVIKGHQRVIVEVIQWSSEVFTAPIHTNQECCSQQREWRWLMTPDPRVEGTRPNLRTTPPLVQA